MLSNISACRACHTHYLKFIGIGVMFDVYRVDTDVPEFGEDEPEHSPNQGYFQEPTQGQPGKPSILIMLQPICSKFTYLV